MAENFVNKKKVTVIDYDGKKTIKKNVGRNTKTKNIDDFSKKLKITKNQTKRLLYNEGANGPYNPYRFFTKGNQTIKLDTRRKFKPILLEQEFIQRITNAKVIEAEKKRIVIKTKNGPVQMAGYTTKDEIVNLNYSVTLFFNSTSDQQMNIRDTLLSDIEANALNNPNRELYYNIIDFAGNGIYERVDADGNVINTQPISIRNGEIDTIKINYNNFLAVLGQRNTPVNDLNDIEYQGITLYCRQKQAEFVGKLEDLKYHACNVVEDYMDSLENIGLLVFFFIEIDSRFSNATIDYYDNVLREKKNLKLHQWNNIEYYPNENDSCVVDMITSRFPDLYWKIKGVEKKYGYINVRAYIDFCVEYSISFEIYNSMGTKIKSYTNGTRGKLVNIVHNNHIYLINGGKPKKIKNINTKYTPVYLYNNPAIYFFNNKIRINNFDKQMDRLVDGDYELFCANAKFSYVLYSDTGDVITKSNIGISKNDRVLSFMKIPGNDKAEDEIYLIHNPEVITEAKNKLRIVVVYDNHKAGKTIYNYYKFLINIQRVEPAFLKFDDSSMIKSFVYDGIYHVKNSYIMQCYDIFKSMGETYNSLSVNKKKISFLDYMFDDINLLSIPKLLCKIFNVDSAKSFIPDFKKFATKPYLYKAANIDRKKIISTIDKNKCHSYALYCLDRLIKVDYRTCKINVINEKSSSPNIQIQPYFMYMIKPNKSTPPMPQQESLPGYHLLECINNFGISFDILEEIETETVHNYYRDIIDLMYQTMDHESFKSCVNIIIGNFEKKLEKKKHRIYVGTYTKEFSESLSGYKKDLRNGMVAVFKNNESYCGISNMSPIATQIKAGSRMLLYRKMLELKLKNEDIVQINTDSISFYGEIPDSIKKTLNEDKLDGWKEDPFKEIGNIKPIYLNDDLSLINIPCRNDKKRILNCNYAGCGKTYHIINNVLPELIKNNVNYIVLTPGYDTKDEYKEGGFNCDIIQRCGFEKSLLKADHIIIDEFGAIDINAHEIFYLLYVNNKSYECYGDFNQLLPVGVKKPQNSEHYIKYMFNEVHNEFANYRNHFTKEFYDELIACTDFRENKKLVQKVNEFAVKNYFDAETIICYRKETKKKYNDLMLKHFGHTTMFEPGVKIACVTNDYYETNNNVYNGHKYIVDSLAESEESIQRRIKNKKIAAKYDLKLKCKNDMIVTIYDKQMRKLNSMFELNYCNNIHKVQGKSVKSYYWTPEDNCFITGRVAYVVISRLKNK